MGFSDRGYYRSEPSNTFLQEWTGVLTLVVANVAIWVANLLGANEFPVNRFLALQGDLPQHLLKVWELVTYGFVHDSFNPWHLVVNMLTLWFFGRVVEEVMGRAEFFRFYFTAIVLAGIVLSWLLTSRLFGARDPRLVGLTDRSRALRAGHRLLVEKYYLDALYERVVVRAIVGPIARAAYAFNQRGLDGVIHAVAAAARGLARVTYGTLDQRIVDGTVNGAGAVAHRAGAAAQPAQSGRVSQYGALLFGAAAVAALVLVLTVT